MAETYTTADGRVYEIGEDGATATLTGETSSQEMTPDSPGYEVSQERANRILDFQRGFLDANPQGYAAFSNKRLLEYAKDNFPGGVNIEKALASGATEEQILSRLYGFDPSSKVEAMTDAVYRGIAEGGGGTAGGIMGFKIGMQAAPVVAGLTGPAAPVAVPLTVGVTTGLGFASGLLAGDTVSDAVLGEEPKFLPSVRPYAEGAYTVGSGLPLPFTTYMHTFKFLPGTKSYLDRVARLQGIKDTPIEAIQRTALDQPKRFLALEGTAIGQSGVGGFIAEQNYPGDGTMRFLFEAGAGSTSPLIVGGLERLVSGAKNSIQMLSESGRTNRQAVQLVQFLEENGQNPQAILDRLRSPDDVKAFAAEMGITMPDRTPANVAGNDILFELQNALARDKTFGPTLRKALSADYKAMGNLIEVLDATGDPTLLARSAQLRKDMMEAIIIQRLSDANDQAVRINKQVAPTKKDAEGNVVLDEAGNPEVDTRAAMKASKTIETVTAQAIQDVRKVESQYYDRIDGREDIDVPIFLEALTRIENETGGAVPYLPVEARRLADELRGVDAEAAATTNARMEALDKKVQNSQDAIRDIEATDPAVGTFFADTLTPQLRGDTLEGQLATVQSLITQIENLPPPSRARAATGAPTDAPKKTPYQRLSVKLQGTNARTFFDAELEKIGFDPEDMRLAGSRMPPESVIRRLIEIENQALSRVKAGGPAVRKNQQNIAKLAETLRLDIIERRQPRGVYEERNPLSEGLTEQGLREVEDILENAGTTDLTTESGINAAIKTVREEIKLRPDPSGFDLSLPYVVGLLRDLKSFRAGTRDTSATGLPAVMEMRSPGRNRVLTALRNQAKILSNSLEIRELQDDMMLDLEEAGDLSGVTLSVAMTAKSRLQDAARGYAARSEFNEARVLNELAGSLTDDIGVKSGGIRQDDGSITFDSSENLTENQIAIRDAYNFSRSLNDVFTRAFPAKLLEKEASGARHIMPELAHKAIFSGGGDETSLRLDQINQAMDFVAEKAGKKVSELGPTATLGTMDGAQETLMRAAFEKIMDPQTNRVDPEALAKFNKEYRNVLFLEDGTARFPDLVNDLSSVESAEKLLSKRLRQTGDPRAATADGSPLGPNTPASGFYQESLDNQVSWKTALGSDKDPMGLVGMVIADPGSKKASDVNGLRRLIKLAQRSEAKNPGASAGLRSMILQKARMYATGKPTKGGEQFFNFAKFKEFLTEPMVPGQPSALEIMRQEGLVDEGFALRLTEIMNTGVQTQKAVAQTGEAADLSQVVPKTERLATKAIRFLGLRFGRATTERVPGSGQGLAEPVMIADEVQRVLSDIPNVETFAVLEKAALDQKFFETLLEKGITGNTPRARINARNRLRAALINAGFISTQSEERMESQRRATLPRSGYGTPAPAPAPQPAVGDQSSAAQVTPTQLFPDLPTTDIASVSPSMNPVGQAPANRARFAALFPEDRALIEGIGSLG